MKTDYHYWLRGAAVAALIAPIAVAAQRQAPAPAPTIPGVGDFSLPVTPTPTPTPTPSSIAPAPPTPAATPTPRATSSPRVTPSPTPTPTPRASPRPGPSPTPTPSASATPEVSITPVPTPANIPVTVLPTASPAGIATPAETGGTPLWLIPAALFGIVLIGALIFVLRRRRAHGVEETTQEPVPERPPLPPAPPPLDETLNDPPRFLEPATVAATTAGRAWIEFEVHPRRAGVNMFTATADIDLTLRNVGETAARDITVEAHLSSARAAQDEALGKLFAAPIERPIVAPFELAPGDERTVRALLAVDRNSLNVLIAVERPMFVPVVAVNVVYALDAAHVGQTAAAFAVGIEREGVTKLAPFWLDTPSRMHDELGLRPHALTLKS